MPRLNYVFAREERSGLVEECIARDRGVTGSNPNRRTADCPQARQMSDCFGIIMLFKFYR